MRVLRTLALLLSSGGFFLFSCSGSLFLGVQVIADSDARDTASGDQVHEWFEVAVQPGEEGAAFRVVQLGALPELRQSGEPGSGIFRSDDRSCSDLPRLQASRRDLRVGARAAYPVELAELVNGVSLGSAICWHRSLLICGGGLVHARADRCEDYRRLGSAVGRKRPEKAGNSGRGNYWHWLMC